MSEKFFSKIKTLKDRINEEKSLLDEDMYSASDNCNDTPQRSGNASNKWEVADDELPPPTRHFSDVWQDIPIIDKPSSIKPLSTPRSEAGTAGTTPRSIPSQSLVLGEIATSDPASQTETATNDAPAPAPTPITAEILPPPNVNLPTTLPMNRLSTTSLPVLSPSTELSLSEESSPKKPMLDPATPADPPPAPLSAPATTAAAAAAAAAAATPAAAGPLAIAPAGPPPPAAAATAAAGGGVVFGLDADGTQSPALRELHASFSGRDLELFRGVLSSSSSASDLSSSARLARRDDPDPAAAAAEGERLPPPPPAAAESVARSPPANSRQIAGALDTGGGGGATADLTTATASDSDSRPSPVRGPRPADWLAAGRLDRAQSVSDSDPR
jgi:hypothetical protein